MSGKKKTKEELIFEYLGERVIGGKLSELASYSDLFNRTKDLIFLIHPKNGTILEQNPAADQYFLNLEDQNLGEQFQKIIKKLNSHSQVQMDLEIQNSSESKTFECTGAKLKLSDYSEVIQIIARDVDHERKEKEKLENLSKFDGLTKLWNVRTWKEAFSKIHSKAHHDETTYAVLFCDIDHFKKYNDREGHPAGDEVLRQFSKIVKEVSEKYDGLSCRYGGEEFVLSFENKSELELQNIAEDFMKKVREHSFPHGEKQPLGLVSSSVGIASYPEHGNSFEEVLECADQALYLSKENGRNQFQVFKKKKKSTRAVG